MRHVFFPTMSTDEIDDATFSAFERLVASRESIGQLVEMMMATDVRPLLPEIAKPTLVVHFTGDLAIPIRMGRDLAARIPDAEFLEVNASNHVDLAHSPEPSARVKQFCEDLARAG